MGFRLPVKALASALTGLLAWVAATVAAATTGEFAPSSRDADWLTAFQRADLLYADGPRPDFEALLPIQNCTGGANRTHLPDNDTCTALWWPGLGNGFLGGIAQSPTLRIAGYISGNYGRYTAGKTIPPVPTDGFSNKEFAYRARIPAYAASIIVGGAIQPNSSRAALDLRNGIYYERASVGAGGCGKFELRTYFHRARRNLIVVEATLDCTRCTESTTELSLRAFSGEAPEDVLFHEEATGVASHSPRQLRGILRAPEVNAPSTAHLYDSNYTLGYVHDICPARLMAPAGHVATVRLLSVLTLSSERPDDTDAKEVVVARALAMYESAKAMPPDALLGEHSRAWGSLWNSGGIELETDDLALQQTTNSSLYYLLMSTRDDWLHATLVPSSIAAAAPYPHGYYGTTFWDQDTFQAPPLMVFHPSIGENLLRNRLFQLPAYRVNARAFGLDGAYIPWEVGFTGGFARDNRINHIEVHVAADVALFLKQWFQLTRNKAVLRELYPLLEGIADFTVSRVNRTDRHGHFSIETVEGSDEKPHDCNNDIFTNAVFVQALETALEAAVALDIPLKPGREAKWREAASKIKLGFFEGQLLHKEFDAYAGQVIGQGDTVLLGFPLQFNTTHRIWGGDKKQTRLNDIRYYGQRVDPQGSYMTAGHYVIAWLERPHRDLANASAWFSRGRAKNYAPWRIWSEHDWHDGGAVNFVTAGGMFLQSLLFGYAGVRFDDRGLSMDPVLPPDVRAMTLRGLNFADAEFDVSITRDAGVHFSRRAGDGGDSGRVQVHPDEATDGVHWLMV